MATKLGTKNNDWLTGTNDSDLLMGREGDDTLSGYGGDDDLWGGIGYDYLYGENGDDLLGDIDGFMDGGSGIDTLVSDYSKSNYGGAGINFGITGWDGNYQVNTRGYSSAPILKFTGIEKFEITGTQYDDYISGAANSLLTSKFNGEAGNDTLYGLVGTYTGGTGTDVLEANYYLDSSYSQPGRGVHLGWNGEQTIRSRYNGGIILNYSEIETFKITGTNNADAFLGGTGNDTFFGLGGNDEINGGAGNDILDGGTGNDVLEGGAGDDQLFDSSGSDTLSGGAGNDYIYSVADIQNSSKQLYGGAGSDTFVLDLKGNVTLGYQFNTQTLSNFVNAITLPQNEGFDWKKMGIDLGFGLFGAAAGAMPVVGPAAGFMTSVLEMGVNGYLADEEIQKKISEQEARANQASRNYANANWGTISQQGVRDTIYINDFQIGIDTIVLPALPKLPKNPLNPNAQEESNYSYQVQTGSNLSRQGVFLSVKSKDGTEPMKDVAFIANNYNGIYSPSKFEDLIQNLVSGSVIGKFKASEGQSSLDEIINGSLANDDIDGKSGNDQILGDYGDDALFGDTGNDILYGGPGDNPSSRQRFEAEYGHDGNDFLSGGLGNDSLYGETGDDFLNGGAGYDILKGDSGNDTLIDTEGSISGGSGIDTLIADYSQSNYGAGVHLGYLGANLIQRRNNGEAVISHSEIEVFKITGTLYNDAFEGQGGNDTFTGGAGDDFLLGNGGDDVLVGGTGNDILAGGTGADKFVFNEARTGAGVDLIQDFNRSQGDKIEIGSSFGATNINQFTFNASSGALLFQNQQFATLQLPASSNFSLAQDIVLTV